MEYRIGGYVQLASHDSACRKEEERRREGEGMCDRQEAREKEIESESSEANNVSESLAPN